MPHDSASSNYVSSTLACARVYVDFSVNTVKLRAIGRPAPRAGGNPLCGAGPLPDLQEQRDELALAMRVCLGEHGFQLIARRFP